MGEVVGGAVHTHPNTSSLHTNTPRSANAQMLIIIYSHQQCLKAALEIKALLCKAPHRTRNPGPAGAGRAPGAGTCGFATAALVCLTCSGELKQARQKITSEGRSSFCYQPKASPALGAAKGSTKLHPAWGLLHMTEHWDSQAKKNPAGTFLQVPGEWQLLQPGSPDRAASTALL